MADYIVDVAAKLAEYEEAIAKAEGMPRRGVVVGGPDYLPQTYTPGAPGWTSRATQIVETADGKLALEIPLEVQKRLGMTVKVGSKDVALPAKSELKPVTLKDAPVEGKAK